MRTTWLAVIAAGAVLGWAACGPSEDPNVRMGNLFFKNKQFDSAYQAYEKAVAANPKNLEAVRANLKNSYYYYGGQLEMSDSVESALKYYEKGFALDPSDVGMCDKLAKYYFNHENFAKAVNYFQRLVELDAEQQDSNQKAQVMGSDYYALGYCDFNLKKYAEAAEALKASLKYAPKGQFAAKAKDALAASQAKLKK